MKIIQKGFELPSIDYYKTHFRIINAVLPIGMTEKEVEILSMFLSLHDGKTAIFNPVSRKRVMDILKLSQAGLSGHFKNMKIKKYLSAKEEDELTITPALLPDSTMQGYNFKLKKA